MGPSTRQKSSRDRTPAVEVRRSARRRRTVSAYRDGGTVVVMIPGSFSPEEEHSWVQKMLDRLEERSTNTLTSDAQLLERAHTLIEKYCDAPGDFTPSSVKWVRNQHHRWGSCTPARRTIRLSHRLLTMPEWVIEYVLMHEIAHLKEAGHTEQFWEIVNAYPHAQRARGFLEGFTAGRCSGTDDPGQREAREC